MRPPKAGQIWQDKNGLQRVVRDVSNTRYGPVIYWRRPRGETRVPCDLNTWQRWARKNGAFIVETKS